MDNTSYVNVGRSDEELLLLTKCNMMLYALDYCCIDHEASITITVEHTNGTKVVLDTYSHAALIQGLKDAVDYFKSEL